MTPTPPFAFPPLSTPLRTALEAMIDRLSELRWSRVASEKVYDDSPADLHALASFVKEFALAGDEVLRAAAQDAGLIGTAYLHFLSDAIEGELLYAITERAERIGAEHTEEQREAERRGSGMLTAKNWGYRDE